MSLSSRLKNLEQTGLIRLARALPEIEYLFRHALVQDAAYDSLVKSDRRQLHLVVGEALERLYPDRHEELYGLLAHHFAAAGDRERAVQYGRLAARRAVAAYAYEEALLHLQTALAAVTTSAEPDIRLQLLEELGNVHRHIGQGSPAISRYLDALGLQQTVPAPDWLTELRLHRKILQAAGDMNWSVDLGPLQAAGGVIETSRARLLDGLRALEAMPPQAEKARILATLSVDAWRVWDQADWDLAERYAREAVAAAEESGAVPELSESLQALARVYYVRGLLREQVELVLRQLELSRDPRFGNPHREADALREAGRALTIVGEYGQALPYLEEAEALAARIQAVLQVYSALALQAQCNLRLDRWDEVLALEGRWRGLVQKYPRERTGPVCFAAALTGRVLGLRGQSQRAAEFRQEATDIMLAVTGSVEAWVRNHHY